MLKRIIPALLAALILFGVVAPVVAGAQSAASGTCGEGISWSYDNYTLTVSGAGEMADGSPWEAYKDKIEKVVFTGGVTKVGAKAFENYDSIESIDFGDAMVEIGQRAFYDCNDIVEIRLPTTFKRFGEESFRNCQNLQRVICEGGMPSFKSSCLYTGNYISVFYPPNNPWPYEYVSQLINNYGGLLGVNMASEDIINGTYAFDPVEIQEDDDEPAETTEATEAEETTAETQAKMTVVAEDVTEATEVKTVVVAEDVTETTAPPATQPPATLPPATDPTVAPSTEAETIAATELQIFTEPTEPVQEEKESFLESSWMGLVMIAGVLTFVLAGVMIVRSSRNKNGY